ncbi:uncharacterized protein LOC142167236 [Nicotiana tabacum]|uniref:Uncharacterized protein LOC142167236 n=1 Tax=Nicotiana tabacum TaxID=4097 RepID=A0AC58SEU7_TOBAC
MKVDFQKIEVVKNWPRPTSVFNIRSFLGLASYYRRFVEGFSSISSPLTRLTQKKAIFQQSYACEKSFEELKNRLTSAPVLTLPEGTEGFVVYCNASGVDLGCVLMQHGKANVVADALSHGSMGSLAHVETDKRTMTKEVHRLASLGVRLLDFEDGGIIFQNRVIVDRLTKSDHFLPVKTTDSVEDYAKLYIQEIVRLHGTPLSIISDRGAQFTTNFWKSFQKGLGTRVNLSTAFHPQANGRAERTQNLEDMLRACVIDFKEIHGRLVSVVPTEIVRVKDSLTYEEIPVTILDR